MKTDVKKKVVSQISSKWLKSLEITVQMMTTRNGESWKSGESKSGPKARCYSGGLGFYVAMGMHYQPDKLASIPVIAAGYASDDSVFELQVIQEAGGTMIISPDLDHDQFSDAIGAARSALRVQVFKIFVYAIITRRMLKTVNPLFLPDLNMVRIAALCQHAVLVIPHRYQPGSASQTGCGGLGQRCNPYDG